MLCLEGFAVGVKTITNQRNFAEARAAQTEREQQEDSSIHWDAFDELKTFLVTLHKLHSVTRWTV